MKTLGWGLARGGGVGFVLGVMKNIPKLILATEYTKSHRIVHIKWSIVYVAYINKTVYKKAFKGKYKPSFH